MAGKRCRGVPRDVHFSSDQPETGIGLLIVTIGVTAGAICDRKKLIVQIKG
jgi:hypothetical protein